jgi:putative cardiolipin synthase
MLVLALVVALTTGCASVDFDYPKTVTTAFEDTVDTHLGRQIAKAEEEHPGRSGFHLLADPIDSLAARLLLARRAERSLDAQYYLITADHVGSLFIGALLEAADRGVRVRLLLDDIQTQGYDAGMAALDSHPNFEVRIFNPFAGRSSRVGDGVTSFKRINRRMHNKSFTVDNQVTIVGGRNIADEYFGAREDVNFGDLDVLGIGPVVDDVSDMFDTYWNHRSSLPVPAFAKMPEDPAKELEELRQRIARAREEIVSTRYADVVREDIQHWIESDVSVYTWAPYQVVYDSPDKSRSSTAEEADSIVDPLRDAILSAQEELLLVSPYFVPRKSGVEGFQKLRDEGLRVRVITNSLASTNHNIVHTGYAPSRKPLLKMGVELYEVRPDVPVRGSEKVGTVSAEGSLHTKAFIVDRQKLFVGSFNFDPRSANLNTELGVIIDSPEMAGPAVDWVDEALPRATYEVTLNDKGKLVWTGQRDGEPEIWTKEPRTGFWTRFNVSFMRILPIKGQL